MKNGFNAVEDRLLAALRAGAVFPVRWLTLVELNSMARLSKRGLCRFAGGVYARVR